MNTPAHLILGAALFARPATAKRVLAGLAGGAAPDLSLYVMAGTALFVLGIDPSHVFNVLYFSEAWQTVFAVDNSFFVWGALLGLALWRKSDLGRIFCAAALVHIALDFPLHHDDGRPHFWPVSTWVFESPVSYWDRRQGAFWVAPVEATLVVIGALAIWRRKPSLWISLVVALLLGLEIWIVREWLFFFQDS